MKTHGRSLINMSRLKDEGVFSLRSLPHYEPWSTGPLQMLSLRTQVGTITYECHWSGNPNVDVSTVAWVKITHIFAGLFLYDLGPSDFWALLNGLSIFLAGSS